MTMMIMMMMMTMMIGLQESELLGTPPEALWSKLCPNSDREAPRRHGSPPPRRHGSPPPPCQAPTPACVLCPRDVPDGTIAISPTAWRASLRAVSFRFDHCPPARRPRAPNSKSKRVPFSQASSVTTSSAPCPNPNRIASVLHKLGDEFQAKLATNDGVDNDEKKCHGVR